ncbi:MAG: tetratricopeptide repeat protein [Desulfosarcinaceae bacterium]|nr:tetratricopeptide repeat protein [Desulfosarcinaceae bacterium]
MHEGLRWARAGNPHRAATCFSKIVEADPTNAIGHFNLALARRQLGDLKTALVHYEIAARLDPDDTDTLYNWGNTLLAAGDPAAAVAALKRVIRRLPPSADLHTNLAAAHQENGELAAALDHFEAAAELDPSHPDRQWNLALALLKSGDYVRAWPLFESRLYRAQWQANYPHRHSLPRWCGEPFPGKHLLVHFEQGYGDTIQFLRYLPRVKALGGRVTLEVPQPLLPLANRLPGVDATLTFQPERPTRSTADLFVPLMSLAGIFGTRPETIPADIPYLQPPPDRLQRWQRVCRAHALNVGLVWAGADTDPLRACRPDDLGPLLALPGINWIGMQTGRAAEALPRLPDGSELVNLGPELRDFGDTAAIIHHLDLVVSVDTATAHLAGALGTPTFCLLRFAADWRWGATGAQTPWYSTLQLFRQGRDRQWSTPVKQVAATIVAMHAQRQPPSQPQAPTGGDGTSLKSTGRRRERARQFQRALNLSANGSLTDAAAAYRRLLAEDPEDVTAQFNLAICLRQSGELATAREAYEGVIAKQPDFHDAIYNLGNLHLSQKRYREAAECYQRVIELVPDHQSSLVNLSEALKSSGALTEAEQWLKAGFARWPDSPVLHHQMGQLHSSRGAWSEAVTQYQHAVAKRPDRIPYRYNLGHALFQLGRYSAAALEFREILARAPNHTAAQLNLGNALKERGELEAAEKYTLAAVAAEPDDPDSRWNLAVIRLMRGDYGAAWNDFEARWERPNWQACYPFRLSLPRWRGQSLAGKTLFVHDEQGFGDTLQFVRYLPLLRGLGGRVLFETRAPLAAICRANELADTVLLRGDRPHIPADCDYGIPLMSVPGVLDHAITDIPATIPYLKSPSNSIERWAKRLPAARPKVGLVWSGRPTRADEAPGLRGRSCGLAVLQPLIDAHAGICFLGLQQGAAAGEIHSLGLSIPNYGTELGDFVDTAGLVAHLDLVITVDTAMAHLAGAMGKPVWVLLQQVGDWRWLLDRCDSSWYPSARLIRQAAPGDWESAVRQVAELLRGHVFR